MNRYGKYSFYFSITENLWCWKQTSTGKIFKAKTKTELLNIKEKEFIGSGNYKRVYNLGKDYISTEEFGKIAEIGSKEYVSLLLKRGTTPLKDYDKLKEILDTAMIMGFERNMFIDIKWSNEALWQEHLGIRKKCDRPSKIHTKFRRNKNHKKSIKTLNGITLQDKVLPKSLRVKELVNGLYEIEGYDYFK